MGSVSCNAPEALHVKATLECFHKMRKLFLVLIKDSRQSCRNYSHPTNKTKLACVFARFFFFRRVKERGWVLREIVYLFIYFAFLGIFAKCRKHWSVFRLIREYLSTGVTVSHYTGADHYSTNSECWSVYCSTAVTLIPQTRIIVVFGSGNDFRAKEAGGGGGRGLLSFPGKQTSRFTVGDERKSSTGTVLSIRSALTDG